MESSSCTKHPHERPAGTCRRCGMAWCGDCLVYVYGTRKPPYCIGCAMFAGGVRSAAVRPAMSRKALRAQQKAEKAAAKDAKRAAAAVAAVPAEVTGPAEGGTDWSTPWWEDQREREPTPVD